MDGLKFEYLPVSTLKPYEKNARKHGVKDVDAIVESIKYAGFNDPIGVWGPDNLIVEGHGRLLAAKKLGLKVVPCIRLDHLTDEQRRAYALAHNKTADLSDWDFSLLDTELEGIEEIDMSLFGFDLDCIDDEPDIQEDDFDEEPPAEPISQPGYIYQLGRHRLMCGDSTDASCVERLMDGIKADMVMTDPPYGIDAARMQMGSGDNDYYRGDTWDHERVSLDNVLALSDKVCIWGGNYYADILPVSNDWLVFVKTNVPKSFSQCELAWSNFGCKAQYFEYAWHGEKKLHITMKPLSVIAWAIQQLKENAPVVLDPFGGSGTTMIACEQLGRTCYMMEKEPKYIDVIIKRFEELTGQKAILINPKEEL